MPSSGVIRALFVGNSQLQWGSFDLTAIVKRLSRGSAPARIESAVAVRGGATLEQLWNEGEARSKIAGGGWDWVVCHELVYSLGGSSAKFQEFAENFSREAQLGGAKMLFYATGEIESARAGIDVMYADALAAARKWNGRVAGGGMAWLKAWAQRPDYDFHFTDRAHPNERGYYINACVVFAALTDRSPVGLDPCELPADEAKFLQTIAWEQYNQDRSNERRADD